jgi:hypothetical protein
MGRSCGTYRGEESVIQGFGEQTPRGRLLGRPRLMWEGNTKMDVKVIEWKRVNRINLAQDGDTYRDFVNTFINLQFQ